MNRLIGQIVMHRKSKSRGYIKSVLEDILTVVYDDGSVSKYQYPSCFSSVLILKDESLQKQMEEEGSEADFDAFKNKYIGAINQEIDYLKQTGGKRYRIIDGERAKGNEETFVYSFETDAELHFPEGTSIKLWFPERIINAYIVSCEEYTIVIRVADDLGQHVEYVEFTAEAWQLLEALNDRISELNANENSIAYQLACTGRAKINPMGNIMMGQNAAMKKAESNQITFVWGPPGTGKTTTLAKIALECLNQNKRVLMLSYSNVSVDGALLRVSDMSNLKPGCIIRCGYPRVQKILDSDTLTSYKYALYSHPDLASEYKSLIEEKKKLGRKDTERRIEINKRIGKIRLMIHDAEVEIIQNAAFLATTVSKAVIDKNIYGQRFDMVIFDEASMAYVPQIVFASSLAKDRFCCLGDFRQLPAIVQNPDNYELTKDIFEYTGITEAVENEYGHEWLVMLNKQYRMHPEIADFVSKQMYENLLISSDEIYKSRQLIADLIPIESESMGIVDLSASYSVCIKTSDGSRINLMSAMICVKLAELFAGKNGVGIITPYNAQSRLILAMIRDLQERDERYKSVSCATVHQFQGSEKSIIIYDAVECFRMPYPGMLLTSMANNTANRLFNVALTRTQGKFILVANLDYLKRKHISKGLMFTQAIQYMKQKSAYIAGDDILDSLGTIESEIPEMFLGGRDEIDSWERYLSDLKNAQTAIFIDVPGVIDDDEAVDELIEVLDIQSNNNVSIYMRIDENISVREELKEYCHKAPYVTTPYTIIDKEIVWFGEPLSSADFVSEGNILETKFFPCLRFSGKHIARMMKTIFEIPTY